MVLPRCDASCLRFATRTSKRTVTRLSASTGTAEWTRVAGSGLSASGGFGRGNSNVT